MNQKIFAILAILLLLACSQQIEENVRFADGPMMRKHHNQPAPNADNLTVHLIPHSHDDVGWLKTVDDYYYGGRQDIQWAGVQYTIDTVVSELASNPNYKFSIVEMAFLYRWWNNANETEREKMKTLVKNGQLQFINAGWCMSDEATPYYEDVIDQMTIGLRWLKNTFDFVPDVAWHIDPFGHQASSASMFSQMGFQSFFFARIDYQDKDKRMSEKGLEMIWSPKLTNPDSSNYIFTHVNYYHYSPPPGFCFDVTCLGADPIRDDQSMQGYNIVQKSTAFANYFKSMSLHFRTKNLMHTMGEDFHYANAKMWYKNMDKLINFINSRPQFGVKLIYSTPSSYIKAIQQEKQSYPKKEDDFFPYSDNQNSFWTGYFTSRVSVKGFVRDFGRWLQAVRKQISEIKMRGTSDVIKNNAKALQERIWELQTSMGILQHHDAVAGTEKQRVANDYVATALRSIDKFTPLYRQILKQQMSQQIGESPAEQSIVFNIHWNETAKQTGISQKITANKTVLLALYNPGPAQKRQIRIGVPEHDLKVTSWTNTSIPGDVICTNAYDAANCQLFVVLDFPESGNTYIKIVSDSKSPSAKVVKLKQLTIADAAKQFKLSTTASIKITKSTQKFDLTLNNQTQSFLVNYNYYDSYQESGQKSGAYIFRPASDTPKKYSTIKTIHFAEGTEVVVFALDGDKTYSILYFSKVEGYVNTKGFEIQTKVDSIPITDKIGKEVTLNLVTTYQNNKTFYTDSNGLQEQTRILNYRPTWPLVVHQPTAGNYYPVNSHIGIKDVSTNKKVTVLTDRTQGGSVLREGDIELMIHRRLLMDDARGVGEPLNETQADGKGLIQIVRHWVVFGDSYRQLQMDNDQKVAIAIVDTASNTFAKRSPSPVAISVPKSVKLYLRPFSDGTYLLRVQNFDLSTVSVTLPAGWDATEYTLSANQLLADWKAKQYKWSVESQKSEIKTEVNEQEKSWLAMIKNWVSNIQSLMFEQPSEVENVSENQQNLGAEPITLGFLKIRTFKILKQN